MSWLRFAHDGAIGVGKIHDGHVLASPSPDLLGVLQGTDTEVTALPLDSVQPLGVVAAAPSFRDFMSFERHVSTLRSSRGLDVPEVWYQQPVFYFSNPAALLGPEDSVPRPPGSSSFDYEIEIGALVSRDGRDLTVEEAAESIAGYFLLCDWSARDLQLREYGAGLGPAKAKDSATSVGAVLITPTEWEELLQAGREITATVSGRLHSTCRIEQPYWSFPQMIAYASRGATVKAGDIIGSGTLGGGCLWELRSAGLESDHPWLEPGDVVEIHGGPLGRITAAILAGKEPNPLGPPALG